MTSSMMAVVTSFVMMMKVMNMNIMNIIIKHAHVARSCLASHTILHRRRRRPPPRSRPAPRPPPPPRRARPPAARARALDRRRARAASIGLASGAAARAFMGNRASARGSKRSDPEAARAGGSGSGSDRDRARAPAAPGSSGAMRDAKNGANKAAAARRQASPAPAPSRATKARSGRRSEEPKRAKSSRAAAKQQQQHDHEDARQQQQQKQHVRAKADDDRGAAPERRPPPQKPSPGALALQAALKKSASAGPPAGIGGGPGGGKPHPLAAALAGAHGGSAGGPGAGAVALRPVFNPADFAKATLKKSAAPNAPNIAASAPQESGMDAVRQKAIEDARKCSKEASSVYPWLSVSGDWVARNKEVLHEAGVTHILNMAHTVCKNYHQESGEFDYLALDVIDSANESILPFLLEAIMYIEKARTSSGSCFVHCHMGVSRSCTVVIAYMMWKDGASFDEAFAAVKAKRPVCNPNAGFVGQLMEFERYLRKEPRKPELYRIAPHSSKDPSLVLKLCYDTRETTRPVTARPTELDARGVFVLHDYSEKACFIWTGPRCEHEADFVSAAEKWIGWSIDLLPFFKSHSVSYCQDQDPEIHRHFWIALGVDAADAEEMDDGDVDQDLGKYDEEYGRRKTAPHNVNKAAHRSAATSPDELRRAAERYSVALYGWFEDEHHQDFWEKVDMYDSDDLTSDAMFVLFVKDREASSSSLLSAPADEVFERAYIWLGSQLEGRINEDASVSKAKAFIHSRKSQTHSSTVEIVIEHDEAESDDFWTSFEAGY